MVLRTFTKGYLKLGAAYVKLQSRPKSFPTSSELLNTSSYLFNMVDHDQTHDY
jgi:hypothetical protein